MTRGGTTAVSESGGASLPHEVNHLIPDGSSASSQRLYASYVQEYAEQLASESARQEASTRAPGARATEITESVVIRARESLEQQTAKRQRPADFKEAAALAGMPLLSGTAGVMGSNLHGLWQWAVFGVCALGAVICILYLLKRRLL